MAPDAAGAAPLDSAGEPLRLALRLAADALLIYDASATIVDANEQAETVLGRSRDELIGRPARSVDPDLTEEEIRRIEGAVDAGAWIAADRRYLRQDGSRFPVEARIGALELDGRRYYFNSFRNVWARHRAEVDQREWERRFRTLLERVELAAVMVGLDGRVLFANRSLARTLKIDLDHLVGSDWFAHLAGGEKRVEQLRRELLDGSLPPEHVEEVRSADGDVRRIRWSTTDLLGPDGTDAGLACIGVDVTDETRLRSELELQQEYFKQLFESTPMALVVTDPDDRVLDLNPGFEELFGWLKDEVRGRPIDELVVPAGQRDEGAELSDAVRGGRTVHRETLRRRRDGTLVDVAVYGSPLRIAERHVGVFGIYLDITDRKRFEAKLLHEALHDSLTGLPNRTFLLDRLERAFQRYRRDPSHRFAVLFVDLDRFKVVNDSLGHDAGDELLVTLADRIRGALRPFDTIARHGGDEFTILLEDIGGEDTTSRIAERVLQAVAQPVVLRGREVVPTASIGIATIGDRYSSAGELLRDSDTAMYRAKAAGRDRFALFDPEMHHRAVTLLELEGSLRQAARTGALLLHYQPVVALGDRRIVGVEALLRWRRADGEIVPPSLFVPVAEESGLIVPIGAWALEEACRQLGRWRAAGQARSIYMAVNLSAAQFSRPEIVGEVGSILRATDTPGAAVRLEITESIIAEDEGIAADSLRGLQDLGIGIFIDDFGTGYSSLAALHNYPIDTLKIDQSFVGRLSTDPGAEQIVAAIVQLASALGINTMAEGVETEEQASRLQELGCRVAQGFLFSRPVPADELERLLRSDSPFG